MKRLQQIAALIQALLISTYKPMRTFFQSAALAVCVLFTGCTRIQEAFLEYKVRAATEYVDLRDLNKLHVVLCGTGTPQQADRSRAQACTVVAAGGHIFLFDAGEGAAASLESLRIPASQISNIFITHWHSDHFNGLGTVINHSWMNGRSNPMTVYGPPGVEAVVQGLYGAYAMDASFRATQLGNRADLAFAMPNEIRMSRDESAVRVFDRDGVTVDAYRMVHHPVDPSYGYVIQYCGKKVFVSGDTKVDSVYLPAMKNADIVVHEAVHAQLLHGAAEAMRRIGLTQRAALTDSILDSHADTLQLAGLAEAASVKHLVLTHLIPAPDNLVLRHLFVRGMHERYQGQVTLGEDGTHIILPLSQIRPQPATHPNSSSTDKPVVKINKPSSSP
jgi:ribonuclease Z